MSQARANPGHARYIRIAELGIDSAQLAGYMAAAREQISPSWHTKAADAVVDGHKDDVAAAAHQFVRNGLDAALMNTILASLSCKHRGGLEYN